MNRKSSTRFLAGVAAFTLVAAGQAYAVPSPVVVSSVAPTADADDQSLFSNTNINGTGVKIYTDANGNFGQSFTTGSNPLGYTLSGFSVQVRTTSAAATGDKTFAIRAGALSGSTFDVLANETGHVQSGPWSANDWWTFTFDTPVLLDPDTLYGVDGQMTAANTSWQTGIPYFNFTGNSQYAGGTRYSRADGNPGTVTLSGTNDLVFHVDLAAVAAPAMPEPASAALCVIGMGLLAARRRRLSR